MSSTSFLGEDVFLISVDDTGALAEYVNLDNLPTGNQAIISSGEAKKHSVSVGDSVSLKLGNREISFVISGITDAGIGVIIFDADYFGISPNLLLVSGGDDVGDVELIRDITSALKEELAPVIEPTELFRGRMRNVNLYLRSCLIIIIILVVFAFIGLADNLSESHRSRKAERSLYIAAGVSERDVKRMRLIELAFVFCVGTVIGILAAIFATAILSRGTLSFGYELIINLKRLF
jgi:ABC-type lipoprotein release transport system permease subunit